MPGDFAQIIILGGADAAIGEGDVKQTAEKVFEHGSVDCEQAAHLSRIALEPRGAFAGEVEDEPHVIFFSRRHLKNLAKGGDLVAGDRAIGLGHLGAERDHRDRERDAAPRVALHPLAVAIRQPVRNMAGGASKQGTERPAKGQISGAGNDAADESSWVCSSRSPGQRRSAVPFDDLFHNVNPWYNLPIKYANHHKGGTPRCPMRGFRRSPHRHPCVWSSCWSASSAW